jgi:hypothetical protein
VFDEIATAKRCLSLDTAKAVIKPSASETGINFCVFCSTFVTDSIQRTHNVVSRLIKNGIFFNIEQVLTSCTCIPEYEATLGSPYPWETDAMDIQTRRKISNRAFPRFELFKSLDIEVDVDCCCLPN